MSEGPAQSDTSSKQEHSPSSVRRKMAFDNAGAEREAESLRHHQKSQSRASGQTEATKRSGTHESADKGETSSKKVVKKTQTKRKRRSDDVDSSDETGAERHVSKRRRRAVRYELRYIVTVYFAAIRFAHALACNDDGHNGLRTVWTVS